MAIVIRNLTECPLCGDVITEDASTVMFPAFIWNEDDPLAFFNDAAFHAACFQAHPLAERVTARVEELRERSGPGHRDCAVCRATINDPDDYLFTGYLSDDPTSPLHAFNYLNLHRSCIHRWSSREELGRHIREARNSGKWKGGWLDYLLNAIDIPKGDFTGPRQ